LLRWPTQCWLSAGLDQISPPGKKKIIWAQILRIWTVPVQNLIGDSNPFFNFESVVQRNWVLATNSDCLIPNNLSILLTVYQIGYTAEAVTKLKKITFKNIKIQLNNFFFKFHPILSKKNQRKLPLYKNVSVSFSPIIFFSKTTNPFR